MMKEGRLENGLLGSASLIVQKSHQINTEGHLLHFFSQAFQNGLSYENSEITKAPIKHYAHTFFFIPLKAFECALAFRSFRKKKLLFACLIKHCDSLIKSNVKHTFPPEQKKRTTSVW